MNKILNITDAFVQIERFAKVHDYQVDIVSHIPECYAKNNDHQFLNKQKIEHYNGDIIASIELIKNKTIFSGPNKEIEFSILNYAKYVLIEVYENSLKDKLNHNQTSIEEVKSLGDVIRILEVRLPVIVDIQIEDFSLDNSKSFELKNYELEIDLKFNIPDTKIYISFNDDAAISPNYYKIIAKKLSQSLLSIYYNNLAINSLDEVGKISQDTNILSPDSIEDIHNILDVTSKYFKSKNIVLWEKVYEDGFYKYKYNSGGEDLVANFSHLRNTFFSPNYNRKYGIHIIDFQEENISNFEFHSVLKGQGFTKLLYVPIIDNNTSAQNGILAIFSKYPIKDISQTTRLFLENVKRTLNELLTSKRISKIISIKNSIHDSSYSNSITKILAEIKVALNSHSVILYPDISDLNKLKSQYYVGTISSNGIEKIEKTVRSNFDEIGRFFNENDRIYFLKNKQQFISQIKKVVGPKNFNKDKFNLSFYVIEGYKSFVVFHVIDPNKKKKASVFINFKDEIDIGQSFKGLIKIFSDLLADVLENIHYKQLIDERFEFEKIRRKIQKERSKLIELKKDEIEQILLNKMPSFFNSEYFMIIESLFHDIKSLLFSNLTSFNSIIKESNISNTSKEIILKQKSRISNNTERIKDILKLFNLNELEAIDEIDLYIMLNRLKSFFSPIVEPGYVKSLSIKINKLTEIPTFSENRTKISMVFYNLFTNAIYALNHHFQEGEMKIEIDMHFANNVFTIQFKDNGPGVKGVEEDKIFDYGVTSKEEDGLGIGLFYVYEIIVNQLNGYIRYFRSKGNTVFELVIPNNFK